MVVDLNDCVSICIIYSSSPDDLTPTKLGQPRSLLRSLQLSQNGKLSKKIRNLCTDTELETANINIFIDDCVPNSPPLYQIQ